ncbi:MAG: IS3 family transposase [Acidobacteria bacterium]|nr:IS3 family transposase [Acidobacteriota bacterium]
MAPAGGRDRTRYFKKGYQHFQPGELTKVYSFIKEQSARFAVSEMCDTLGAGRSSYYAWASGHTYQLGQGLTAQVKAVFWRHSRRYGSRRVKEELVAEGVTVGRDRVRRVMREQGLRAIQPKSYVPHTTDSRHGQRVSPNLLLGREPVSRPNEVIVGDSTYLPLLVGEWAYLATWLDLYSRLIVGWQVLERMTDELIIGAMEQAILKRKPGAGLIVHSDRGGQYVSGEFRRLLKRHGYLQSMSRADNAYDNAFAESLFSRYKAELLEGGAFRDLAEAKLETFNYIVPKSRGV